jgi:serine/threonine protein kinase
VTSTLPVGTSTPAILGHRYRLGALLGRGGMSDVYRALDAVTGEQVAVKIFRGGADPLDGDRRRRREVELARTLDHPGLVRLLDADTGSAATGGEPAYAVVELIDGETLGQRLRRAPLDEPAALHVAAALADALAYLHGRGIVHRDVKPANVLLDRDGTPKLTDFGVACTVDTTRMTLEGFTVGTPNYLSPEQVTGAVVDLASDVYSLGLVLIEALTGEPVYPGSGVESAVARLHRDPRPPAGISRGFAALLTAMTARDARRRPTAAEVRRRCGDLIAGTTRRHRTRDLLLTVNRTPRRRALAGLGTIGTLAAATVGTLLVLSPEAAPSQSQPAPVPAAPVHSAAAPRPATPAPATSTTPRPATSTHPSAVPVAARPPVTRATPVKAAAARAAVPPRHRPAAPRADKGHGPGKHKHGKGHGRPH